VKQTAPDWLQAIPIIGQLLSAGVKTAAVVLESHEAHERFDSMARQYTDTLARIATAHGLLVLLVEDAQWIDSASCELLLRVAELMEAGARIAVFVTYRPTHVTGGHPLEEVRSKLIARGCVETVRLTGLETIQIEDYVQKRFGTSFLPNFSGWLQHLCHGHPLYLTQYLTLLEQEGVIDFDAGTFRLYGSVAERAGEWEVTGRLADLPLSRDLDTLLDQRIHRLLDEATASSAAATGFRATSDHQPLQRE
jgi:predicted ATPase